MSNNIDLIEEVFPFVSCNFHHIDRLMYFHFVDKSQYTVNLTVVMHIKIKSFLLFLYEIEEEENVCK